MSQNIGTVGKKGHWVAFVDSKDPIVTGYIVDGKDATWAEFTHKQESQTLTITPDRGDEIRETLFGRLRQAGLW